MDYDEQNFMQPKGTVEDQFASEDLARAYIAFRYHARSDEIGNEIVLFQKQQEQAPHIRTFQSAARALIILGMNTYRERRALYYYETSNRILEEIDGRSESA